MEPQPGTEVTGKVTLVEPLGQGAMGSVWRADHTTLKTQVAVKFISAEVASTGAEATERFTLEATAAAQIKSPHVVHMIDHGVTADGTPYIVMELLAGESLDERIERSGPLSLAETVHVVSQVVKALEAAHELGVIHRDIKPHNIFLTGDEDEPFVKVLDFGIAKQVGLADGEEITQPGMIVGTPQYVCRDVIMALPGSSTDRLVDLWALGIVAYKCLTGVLPFDGDSLGAICAALAVGKFDPPSVHRPELSSAVDDWFARALAADRDDRFPTAGELAETFRALLDAPETSTPSPPPATAVERRPVVTLPVVVGVGLAVGMVLVLALRQWGDSAPSDPATNGRAPLGSTPPSGATVRLPLEPGSVAPPSSAAPSPPTTVEPTATASAAVAAPVLQPGPNQVVVPAGEVWMGCDRAKDGDCRDDEVPGRGVQVDAFFIDRTEVTVFAYAECLVDGRCSDRRVNGLLDKNEQFAPSSRCNWQQPGRELHPMNCVSYPQAQGYCEYMGLRLPTEAEWERAARGDDRRLYPWGNQPANCVRAVMADEADHGCGRRTTWPAGAKGYDRSPFGVLDLGGNVREWVVDWYGADYYRAGPTRNPRGPEVGSRRVTRGGSWGSPGPRYLRTSARHAQQPSERSQYVGLRCAGPLR
ncbi:MAG: SUMF1/EgtB/PvdO family nonheme iron enzyme [Deltaproteobacteria bacterium]|nr:SUMF1/EgtB/PvdO family nonheme iron enzyme [Deltaproteobacteria bacterium]